MFLLKLNIKILAKKIVYFNFITKFFGRIFFQPLYKTFRLIKNPKRFRASLWVDWHKEVVDIWMFKKNEKIYIDAIDTSKDILIKRKKFIKESLLPKNTGGGGNEALLFFLIKLINAKKVLETGVEAGASSQSMLKALSINGGSILYSSDLAFILNEEQVGRLVSDEYRNSWFLTHKGDKKNIPIIFEKEKNFDLIYYDSDKSYDSKKWFHEEIKKNPLPKILVYDDIDRDQFFSECVKSFNYKYRVFGNTGVLFFDVNYF
jgi:predicted O-methyltransferase YrrM